jgi:anti-sigma B factor antagonist
MARPAHVAEHSLGDATVIEVRGDLDLSNAADFVAMVLAAAARPSARVVIDLEEANFIDSTVLNALFASAAKLRTSEGELAIVCTADRIYRVLEASGIERLYPIVTSRDAALQRLGVSGG